MIMGTNENINNEKINDKFKEFVEKCVVREDSLLTSDNTLFSKDNLALACTRDFIKKIKPLFDKVNEDARNYNKNQQSEKKKIWGIGDIFNENVFNSELFQKDLKKLNDYKPNIVKILLHCNWLMYLCSDRQHKQNTTYYKENIDDFFKVDTKWSIGPTFSGTSLDAMLFIVELVLKVKEEIKNKSERNIKNVVGIIKELCNNNDWMDSLKWYDEKPISSDAIVNIILFLCDSEHYLPIPAQDKKRLISEKLSGLCKNENTEELKGMAVIDKNLYNIRESIRGIHKQNAEKEYEKIATLLNPFWQPSIRPFWDESAENLNNEKLSDETLLDYKKAMILYGPPGTSKSYQARRIAESMIAKALRKNEKSIVDCINQLQTTLDSHIHILQMHPNYTYDDFIVGKSIEGTNIVVKPGKMLQIIAGIKSDDNLPHFVILDEINRVDISRVFGELFTAMESSYREKGVELSVDVNRIPEDARKNLTIDKNTNKLFLKVPENMYFIGTMNMIDFSLEQVDFALRRRFLWKLSTYDPKRLEEIISEKVAEKIKNLQEEKAKNEKEVALWNNRPDNYIECCTALNNEIEWESNLGKNYLIGHTFFAEIVDIFERVKDWGKAKNILWQVSILPTLDAYCGTMDSEMQKRFVGDCKDAFLPELKDNKKKDNSKQSQDSEITNGQ